MKIFLLSLCILSSSVLGSELRGFELTFKQDYEYLTEKCKGDILSKVALKIVEGKKRVDFNTYFCNQWQQKDAAVKSKISGRYKGDYTLKQRTEIHSYRLKALNSLVDALKSH